MSNKKHKAKIRKCFIGMLLLFLLVFLIVCFTDSTTRLISIVVSVAVVSFGTVSYSLISAIVLFVKSAIKLLDFLNFHDATKIVLINHICKTKSLTLLSL